MSPCARFRGEITIHPIRPVIRFSHTVLFRRTMTAPVLRTDATLVGTRLTPTLARVKGDEPLPSEELCARFESDKKLIEYNDKDLIQRLKSLTADDPEALLQLAGLDHKSQDMLIRLAHFAILAANDTTSAQPINDTEAAKTAAQAAVALLKQKPDDSPSDAKRRAPAASDAGPQNPPPKKKAKRPQPDPGPSDSDSEEEFEDEQAQSALERLKRVCREPAIHMDPLRLGGALRRVIDSTTNAKTKRHYERVHGLFMKNTTSRGIGLEVLKFSMSKHERRFEEEAEKAQANLRRNAREESYHLGPFPAPGGQGPTAALGRAPQGPSFGGWQPNPRRKEWNPPRRGALGRRDGGPPRNECYNCHKKGHWARECPYPPRK
ncbi:uncharacterized protein LOC144884497 [Branchiostoma floridae x Branchiostoma japonicum]